MTTRILTRAIPDWIKSPAKRFLFSKVKDGPFAGMRYVQTACCSAYPPKVLGTYEMEIWDCLAPCLQWKGGLFVDVGAAEGYYAVGMLVGNPSLRTVAFEAEPESRKVLAELGNLNGVAGRLEVKGFATHVELESALSRETQVFALFDIEGGEFDLLDPVLVPSLRHVPFLVEIHDWVYPGRDADSLFRNRFEATHKIFEIKARNPKPADIANPLWRWVARTNPTIAGRLLNERPPIMRWFNLIPRETKS